MNKTAQLELRRLFLIEALPEPLNAASSHIQILDRYIEGTRLRLRQVRDPSTNESNWVLQQRLYGIYRSESRLAEIHLNPQEYSLFDRFRGAEIRKNRYFHGFDRIGVSLDVYLGSLSGLMIAMVESESRQALADMDPPVFSIVEVTNEPLFSGENLVSRTFADVAREIERLAIHPEPSDE